MSSPETSSGQAGSRQKIEVRDQRSEVRDQRTGGSGRGDTATRGYGDAEKRQSVIGYMVMALCAMLSND